MRFSLIGLAAAAFASAGSANAQSTAAKAPEGGRSDAAKAAAAKPDAKTVEGITVTAPSEGVRTSIDRRSYSVATDLQATSGSISEALKNIPSVEVDVQGNLSIRGSTGVTIMVDGKPSAMFRGATGAQALQALPANQIERVEVITNPTAAMSPEGSAGVINLITKQGRGIGRSGSVAVNLGDQGRGNVSLGGAYNSKKLTFSGDLAFRHDGSSSTTVTENTTADPATGRPIANRFAGASDSAYDAWIARAGVDYDPDAATRVSASLFSSGNRNVNDTLQHVETTNPAGGLARIIDDPISYDANRVATTAQVSYRRKFAGDEHDLAFNLNRQWADELNENRFTLLNRLPVAPDVFQKTRADNALIQTQFSLNYRRPMSGGSKLRAGLDLRLDDNDYDSLGLKGVDEARAGLDPNQTNHFLYKQSVGAAFATYERPIGDWTVLGGLRIEDVQREINQLTTGAVSRKNDLDLYPSLHVAYRFSDTQQLVLSYSHRIQRPNAQDLNPFRFAGPFGARMGNPNLRPQDTHSFEAGWNFRDKGTLYLATLYYRRNENGVTDVTVDQGGGFLLVTKQNLASSRDAGLELVAAGKFTKTLSYNTSANLYWTEIDPTGIGLGVSAGATERRSAFAAGGRGAVNWQITPKDLFQANVTVNAKRLLPQGYADPTVQFNLGYRHKLSNRLAFVATATDPFDWLRFRQTIESPGLRQRSESRLHIRAAYVGLQWVFASGNRPLRDLGFDFGGAGGGGGPPP